MSAFGSTTAVVSVGLSCQAAHQIHVHLPLISELVGEPLEQKGSSFDWQIVPPASAARMIADDDFFPTDAGEVEARQVDPWMVRPYWGRRDCYLWHEKLEGRFESWVLKAAHTRRTFLSTAERSRRVFLLCNTQNNLAKEPAGLDVVFTDAAVDDLRQSLADRFGENELYVISYKGRHALSSNDPLLFELEPDDSKWKGDAAQWEPIFREVFA